MKYSVESIVDEYVSCAPDALLARKVRLPTIALSKKGQGMIFHSTKEFEPYARGFNALAQMKKVSIASLPDEAPVAPKLEKNFNAVQAPKVEPKIEVKPEVKEEEVKLEPKAEVKSEAKVEEKKSSSLKVPKEPKPEAKN